MAQPQQYTPQTEHISPPSSITPTRHSQLVGAEFTSPSAYLNHDAYAHTEPNTPHGAGPAGMVYDPSLTFSYQDFDGEFVPEDLDAEAEDDAEGDEDEEGEHSTPPAGRGEDDRTPVVSDTHQHPPIPASSLPAPSNNNQDTIRASSHQHPTAHHQPLMSPFRAVDPSQQQQPPLHAQQAGLHHPQPQPMAYPPPQPTFVDPSFYAPPPGMAIAQQPQQPQLHQHQHQPHMQPHQLQSHAQPQMMAPFAHNPYDPSFTHLTQQQQQQQPPPPPPPHGQQYAMPAQMMPAYAAYPQQYVQMAPQYAYGPPRSRNGSPTESHASSAISLHRSGSTSSELRAPRPKVKLTHEDKRNIVMLHRSNSSLRQEDIARQYGVDRSTISKIILSSHRWTQPQEIAQPPVPRQVKPVGGRFPAIEAMMHEWMDEQISQGLDVRDNIARDKAKAFAKEIGFPMDRFKASAKWLDKFKDRRKAAGRPTTSPMHASYGYYPFNANPYGANPLLLSRSQSTVTLSSSDSSGQDFQRSPNPLEPRSMLPTRSESDLLHIEQSLETMPLEATSRQRSQSSPHLLGQPGMQSPSSGKAQRFARPSPLNLQRQNSYHGSSPSPRRPNTLSRANSSAGSSLRRSRPTSLAASAFGITPIISQNGQLGDDTYSPLNSPAMSASSSGTHSRQRSENSLAPFTTSMSGMTISPDMSDSGGDISSHQINVPLTPLTPAHPTSAASAIFPNTDYGEISQDHLPAQYATMPNKHYMVHHQSHQQQPHPALRQQQQHPQQMMHAPHQGVVQYGQPTYQATDFGPVYQQAIPTAHDPTQQAASQW